jgi:uncharacterized membrane protein
MTRRNGAHLPRFCYHMAMTPITRFKLKPDHLRLLIASYKIVTGTAEIVFASLLLFLSSEGLQNIVDGFTAEEGREDPSDLIVLFVQHHLPDILSGKGVFAIALLTLGVLKVIGGIGFVFKKDWGFWLVVALLAVLLPADVRELVIRPGVGLGLFVLLHASIVYLLVRYRRAFLHANA